MAHIGAVSYIQRQDLINILCEDGNLNPTSVPPKRPGMTGYYFQRGYCDDSCAIETAELVAD